jgi:Mn2+/Fe2+ NRAMP family transporter
MKGMSGMKNQKQDRDFRDAFLSFLICHLGFTVFHWYISTLAIVIVAVVVTVVVIHRPLGSAISYTKSFLRSAPVHGASL